MEQLLKDNKSLILAQLLEYQEENFHDCDHDEWYVPGWGEIYDAYMFDLQTDGDWFIKKVGSQFWKETTRLIDEHNTEIEVAMHRLLAQKLQDLLPEKQTEIASLQQALETILVLGVDEPAGTINPWPSIVRENLQNMALDRRNYKPLTGEVHPEDVEKILKAASGMTPALSNEYNYRINVVPDHLKETLLEATANYSQTAADLKPGYAVDKNYQYLAPLLLCFSIKENPANSDKNQWGGPITKRDPNMLCSGICMWHTAMTAISLGYKTSFINISDFKTAIVKQILGLEDPFPDLRTLDRDGDIDFSPTAFLAVGSDGKINGNTRRIKYADIVDQLTINE